MQSVSDQFEGKYRVVHHLAPPFLSRVDAATGRPRKRRFGGWIRPVLKLLAYGKHLRGSWADVFGYTAERRMEHALMTEYQAMIRMVIAGLTENNYSIAVDLAELPDQIRGFGPVKEDAVKSAKIKEVSLLEEFYKTV